MPKHVQTQIVATCFNSLQNVFYIVYDNICDVQILKVCIYPQTIFYSCLPAHLAYKLTGKQKNNSTDCRPIMHVKLSLYFLIWRTNFH